MFLISFPPLSPDPGQFVWTTIIFILVWVFLGRTAFKPIANGLKKRENDIREALQAADKAKEEMQNLQAKNDRLLQEAQEERTRIINEAKEASNQIISEARNKAKDEAKLIIDNAHQEIENQKNAAISEVKKEVGEMAILVAEKVLKENLKEQPRQKELIDKLVSQMGQN